MKSKIFFAFLIVLLAQSQVSQAEPIFGIIGDLLGSIFTLLEKILNEVNNLISGILTNLENTLSKLTTTLKDLVNGLTSSLTGTAGNSIGTIGSALKTALETALKTFSGIKDLADDFFNEIPNGATLLPSSLTSLINGLQQVVTKITQGLEGKVADIVNELLAVALAAVKKLLADLSGTLPSTLLDQLINLADTIAGKLPSLVTEISDPICALLTTIMGLPGTALTDLQNVINKSTISNLTAQAIQNNPATNLSTIQTTINSITAPLVTALATTLETVGTTLNVTSIQLQNIVSIIPGEIVSGVFGTIEAALPPGIPCLSEVTSAVEDLGHGVVADVTTCMIEVIDIVTAMGNQFIAAGQGIAANAANSLLNAGQLDQAIKLAANSTLVLAELCNKLESCLTDIVGGLAIELFGTIDTIIECVTDVPDLP